MSRVSISCLWILVVCFLSTQAQKTKPLNTPLIISGSFGEPRENHFHTGVDLTTRGKTGIAVYSFEDGYVSRIKVSSIGYGKAVYITHSNGLMSVYGHLSKFNDDIQQYVTTQQYHLRKNEVELYPEKNKIKVSKGQIIAYSGNSGGSGAPHLHFEIRDPGGDSYPLNPLKYHLDLKDTISPEFRKIAFYNTSDLIDVVAPMEMVLYNVKGVYKIQNRTQPDTVRLPFISTGIGIKAYDLANGCDSDGFFGIYSMNVTVDDKTVFEFSLDRLDFAEGRYANCHIDYKQKKKEKEQFYRCYLMPGNEAGIYSALSNRGMINLNNGEIKKVVITASDYYKNICRVEFYIEGTSAGKIQSAPPSGIHMSMEQDNLWNNSKLGLQISAKSLYEDLYLKIDSSKAPSGALSKLYKIHDEYTPVHKTYKLSIAPDLLPKNISVSKLIIIRIKSNGNYTAYSSMYADGKITAEPKEFGNFCIMADTSAPILTTPDIKNGQTLTAKSISFTMIDKLSGIESYNFYMDEKWIIAEYDAKSDTVNVKLGTLSKGEHILQAVVIDKVQNKKTFTYKFITP